ncbi:hypothetical protein HQ550_04245 [bacterium]|nr:hypothetical protein [bacterium]
MNKKQLTIEQKSVYLVILNATMILRSIGKRFKKNRQKLKDYKIKLFSETERLVAKMEKGRLKEKDIILAIRILSKKCNISFGQSQKAINVLLKFHYRMYEKYLNKNIKPILNCPLDSIILNELEIKKSLTSINEIDYQDIQNKIANKMAKTSLARIDFDRVWDKRHLKEEGLL